MDIVQRTRLRKPDNPISLNLKVGKWLEKRIEIRGYTVPMRNVLLASVIILVAAVTVVHFGRAFSAGKTDPNAALEKEIKTITAQIGKTIELPADEQPTLATVTDKGKLKGQEFFTNAQDGDKLLIFAKAKKAILFRPSTGKIIDFTNLTSGVASNTNQSSL